MSTRALVVGMALILGAGALGALLLRSPTKDAVPVNRRTPEHQTDTTAGFAGPPIGTDTTPVKPMAEIGTMAPPIHLERLDGGTFSLEAHRGKVVLVNFWATWCAPCRDEMPDLQQLWETYGDDELVVVGVSLDEQGRSVVEEFHQTFPVEYPLLLNGRKVAAEYGADHVVPTSFVISRDGRIVDRHIGAITREEFEPAIRAVL